MKLSSSANSINKIANVGSTEIMTRKLFAYQQCNCKIIAIEKPTSGNNGKLILLGNADSTTGGVLTNGDILIITSRPITADNEFTLGVQPSYSSTDKVTTVVLPTSAVFNSESFDIDSYLCKKIDITEYITDKSIGRISAVIEDGFGSSRSSEFTVSLDNIDRYFYDRKNNSGIFFNDTKIVNIKKKSLESLYSNKYEIYTTIIEIDEISSNVIASDYIGQEFLIISGKAAGTKALVIDNPEGNLFEVIGYFAENFYDPVKYPIEVKINDKVQLSIFSNYWFRFEMGLLSEPTERKNLICGKFDFSTLSFSDFDAIISITGYTYEKEFDDKIVGNIPFISSSTKLTKLSEVNCVLYESAVGSALNKSVKELLRILDTENANFINVDFAAYDVMSGWNILDVIPEFGLYRFNFGKWTMIRDTGDLEYSTDAAFLADTNGEIPDHATKEGSDEKLKHNGWIQVSFESSDESAFGISNSGYEGVADSFATDFQKITGLPREPIRLFFKLNNGIGLNKKCEFIGRIGYEFNGGGRVFPEIYPAMLHIGDSLAALSESNSYILDGNYLNWNNYLVIGSFEKFDGLNLTFFSIVGNALVSTLLSHVHISFSMGGNIDTAASWSRNINARYCGAAVNTVTSQTVLKCIIYNWSRSGTGRAGNMSADELNNMYLKSVSGSNFGSYRKILDFAVDGSDYGDITIEREFDNNVSISDQFEIVNKNINIRLKDFGDFTKTSDYFDCAFMYGIGDGTGTAKWHDYRTNFYENVDPGSFVDKFELQSIIYLGKYKKFNNISLSFGTTSKSGRLDLPNLIIEYWDGNNWSAVENLSVYDVDISDSSYGVDLKSFLCSFECKSWVKRDTSVIWASALNNDVDLYHIRIKTNMSYSQELVRISICETSNLSATIIWKEFENWARNVCTDSNILKYSDLNLYQKDLQFYYVKLWYNTNETSAPFVSKIQLVNRLVGHNSDALCAYFDMLSIENKDDVDYISVNENNTTNFDIVPRISADKYLIENLGNTIGLSNNIVSIENYIKNKVNVNNKFLNIIGDFKGLIKAIPAKLNWDSAQYFYDNTDILTIVGDPTDIKCVVVLKDMGIFRMFVLRDISGTDTIEMYTSYDGKNSWSKDGSTFTPSGNYASGIEYMSIIKDSTSATYHMWIVGDDGVNPWRVFHITWTSWGSFTDENSGNAVLAEGSGGDFDENGIADLCVTGKIGTTYEMHYTGFDSSNSKTIGAAVSSNGNSWSKDANNPLISAGSGWESDHVMKPCVFRSQMPISTDPGRVFVSIYYVGENSTGDHAIGLAIQSRDSGGDRDVDKHSSNPIISNVDLGDPTIVSVCYCYELSGSNLYPFSYDFLKFYYATSSSVKELYTIDGENFATDKLTAEYKDEFGVFDKFISDQLYLDFNSSDGAMLLGFREKFNSVDLLPKNETVDTLTIEYWDGSDWADLDVIQFGVKANTVQNKLGFYFDEPKNWQPINIGYLIDNGKARDSDTDHLKRQTSALYFIRITSTAVDSVSIKRAILLKNVYIIADKYNVWILKDNGFLEHKFCATRLWNESGRRYEIIDISYNGSNNNVIVTIGMPIYSPYTIPTVTGFTEYGYIYTYTFNIFDKIGIIPEIGYTELSKDCRFIHRKGTEITNDNSKKIFVIGRLSDDYVNSLGG